MKSKLKIALWSVVAILVIGLAAGAFWWLRKPQVITFDSGDKVTLLSVDYGKKHAPPGVKPPASTNTTVRARTRSGAFTTPTDTLVLWVKQEHDPQQYAYFQYYVYDMAGTACVGGYGGNGGNTRTGSEVVSIQIPAFPHRQGKFIVHIQEQSNNGQEMSVQKFVIRNPVRGSLLAFTAETLPSTKTDDDFSVTMTKLVAGAQMPYNRGDTDPDDAMNKGVQATFHSERNGNPVTNWEPVSVTTTDGTGNQVGGNVAKNDWQDVNDTVTYQYGLWQDEPAWKMRMEFSQQSDFAGSETWKVPDLTVVPGRQQDMYNYGGRRATTNSVFAETDLNGHHIKLYPAKDFTDSGNNNWMQGGLFFDISPVLDDGWRVAVKVTDPQGNEINGSQYNIYSNSGVTSYRHRFQDSISGMTNINVSIFLHKSRFVEFNVKPTTETPASNNK